MNDLNLMTWFGQREMDYLPKHFVKTNTTITDVKHQWILEKLTGRFYIDKTTDLFVEPIVYFEDPKEAVFYELTWS